MASRTPTEVWAIILDEAVFVPHFFSTDPLAYDQAGVWVQHFQELPYWRSERRRNRLRRVHSRWNAILQHTKYQNRYVRLIDVVEGKVPENAVPQAIRLFTGFRAKEEVQTIAAMQKQGRVSDVLLRLLAKGDGHPRRTQIIDEFNGLGLSRRDSLALLDRMPSLEALFGAKDVQVLANVAHGLRVLTFVEGLWIENLALFSTLGFPHLTTLVVDLNMRGLEPLGLPANQFDRLRHLRIFTTSFAGSEDILVKAMPILKSLGQNLLSLDVKQLGSRSYELPSDFWALLPRLENIYHQCRWTSPPPIGHPLRAIRISACFHSALEHKHCIKRPSGDVLPGSRPSQPTTVLPGSLDYQWRGLGIDLVLTIRWHDLFFQTRGSRLVHDVRYFSKHIVDPWLQVALQYTEAGWKVTDYSGETLHEYLVFLIATHWKRGWNGHGDRGQTHCVMSIAWF